MLTKIKIPLSDMIKAVLALDSSVLDIDQVENLIKFCPTKEEMTMLKVFINSTFYVLTSLSGGLALESVAHKGYFLVANVNGTFLGLCIEYLSQYGRARGCVDTCNQTSELTQRASQGDDNLVYCSQLCHLDHPCMGQSRCKLLSLFLHILTRGLSIRVTVIQAIRYSLEAKDIRARRDIPWTMRNRFPETTRSCTLVSFDVISNHGNPKVLPLGMSFRFVALTDTQDHPCKL